jgi:hypothetical protein
VHITVLPESLKRRHRFADMRRWEDNIKMVPNEVRYECVDWLLINTKGSIGGLVLIR